ncbi:SIMPL domain-containing protein [Halorussus lipolyticus]|uniref:SIMPL domain-containing protein n=1 Tax=Halorussus lipolyticus TaxID=3034024 RepID=UPI0023E80834|nr:SIMPL domain-containing protein [Halorussus sp. DT80]
MTGRTITTDAAGRCEQSPEKAVVEATAIGEGESAASAQENARRCAAAVREALAELDPDRIATTELEVADSSQAFDPATDEAYRAVERLRIDCAPEAVREVVVVASDAGATVPSVEFGLSDETRTQLEADALDAAMDRARAKAERIADAEELSVGGVQEVTARGRESGMSSIVDDALASSGDLDVHPGPIPVSESIEVTYELADE